MRILIIGEYSGLAKHLKNGFTALGHKVTIVSAGDGFKKIKSGPDDINYEIKSLKLLGRHLPKSHLLFVSEVNRRLQEHLNLISEEIDLVIVINYKFLTDSLFKVGVKIDYLKKLLSNSAKLIMLCCGGDPAFYNNYNNGNLKYAHFMFPEGVTLKRRKRDFRFDFLIEQSHLIVPTSYEYFDSIMRYTLNTSDENKISNVIPIPIKMENYSINSCIERKIVILHGVLREQVKGTKFFLKALKKVEKEFPDKVEVIIDGKMPYDDYIKLLDKVDILLDQTNAYGIGVNAALGLMKGKVVLGGNEVENELNMNLGKVPIINAIPDGDFIYRILKDLILNPNRIEEIKLKSRRFAERHLDAKVIAQRYIDLLN